MSQSKRGSVHQHESVMKNRCVPAISACTMSANIECDVQVVNTLTRHTDPISTLHRPRLPDDWEITIEILSPNSAVTDVLTSACGPVLLQQEGVASAKWTTVCVDGVCNGGSRDVVLIGNEQSYYIESLAVSADGVSRCMIEQHAMVLRPLPSDVKCTREVMISV